MSFSSIAVANSFLELSEDTTVPPMTNMKIQKLVYIAHGFSLAMLDEPLIYNHVHAFEWGPVIPVLYNCLKKYGSNPVPGPIETDEDVESLDVTDPSVHSAIIRGVWAKYGKLTAAQLSARTHREDTPWSLTWNTNPYGIIPDDVTKSHYLGLIQPM